MSGIAMYLKDQGINVTGSNNEYNDAIKKLEENGIKTFIGHHKSNIINPDLVIYSKAINEDNEEIIECKEKNIPLMERAKFLGKLTKDFKNSICISGTHGKSTTSSMIAHCFINTKLDPTIMLGAELKSINSNYRFGKNNYFILEACEYKDQFLNFFPTTEVILNIDDDHLDYFKTFDNIKNSFIKFVQKLDNNGLLVINADDLSCTELSKYTKGKTIAFSINNKSNYQAKDISFDDEGYPSFNINDINIKLKVKGKHNIYNALACFAVCDYYNIPKELIAYNLSTFTGVKRRFELLGTIKNNIKVYDDYAHHPTEIKTTLDQVKNTSHNKSWAIFQGHTYSRFKEHLEEFANILKKFDHIIIAPIYAAREINTFNVSEKDLVDLIKPYNKEVCFIKSLDEIINFLNQNFKPNDLVVSIGAGDINKIGYKLINDDVD